jgi:hypothetical protein
VVLLKLQVPLLENDFSGCLAKVLQALISLMKGISVAVFIFGLSAAVRGVFTLLIDL